ncbi:MAG: glycogen/starch/alpha-glucan phosphorylase, partial [Clostridia bacterium]|nr:glycogen/starch/alpha-glucan phosphorylase [Clostridia bacterium]
ALTIGTLDGANVEMAQAVGDENIFIFGLKSNEVDDIWRAGYSSSKYYHDSPRLRRIIEALIIGFNGQSFADMANYLLTDTPVADPYMCMADFVSYSRTQHQISDLYVKDKMKWNKMSLNNIAASGFFSADRSIRDYAENIWNLKPVNKNEK